MVTSFWRRESMTMLSASFSPVEPDVIAAIKASAGRLIIDYYVSLMQLGIYTLCKVNRKLSDFAVITLLCIVLVNPSSSVADLSAGRALPNFSEKYNLTVTMVRNNRARIVDIS